MPAITAVFTLEAVAKTLGTSEDLLPDLSIGRSRRTAALAVYGPGDEYTPAFTRNGIEYLKLLIDEAIQLGLPLNST